MDPQQEDKEEPESSPAPTPPSPQSNTQDAYEAASKATEEGDYTDYSQLTPQLHPKKKWPRVLGWVLIVIVVLAGLGAGGYWLLKHKSSPPKTSSTQQKSTQSSTTASTTTQTKSYSASDLNLSFSYPANWTVSDTNGKLTATSPAMQLTDSSSQTQTGQVMLTIQGESSADFSGFKQGNAVAVLASQKVTYTSPTSTQRAGTYISFLQFAATTAHSALDSIFVTGDSGYQYGQSIPETDVTKVDPDIRVTFAKCSNAACTGATSTVSPLSISSKMWSSSSFSTPIVNMVKSLQLQ